MDQVIAVAADNPKLRAALLAVAPKDDGDGISNVRLDRWLRSNNEATVDRLRLRGGGIEDGSIKWTLLTDESVPLHLHFLRRSKRGAGWSKSPPTVLHLAVMEGWLLTAPPAPPPFRGWEVEQVEQRATPFLAPRGGTVEQKVERERRSGGHRGPGL